MSVERPARDDVVRLAEANGFALSEEDIDAIRDLAERYLPVYDRLDGLREAAPASVRPGGRPGPDENPAFGWVWKGSIRTVEDGRLTGRQVAVKDNICLAGVPMLCGSPVMEGFVPERDATVVQRVLAAGGEIVGKTACPAFCLEGGGLTGYPEPQPVNPRDDRYLPGGSSSGNAAVLVTGGADFALGTDQAGSVRLPAAWSGCVGLKPTYGLIPYTGIFPIETTLDHVGPMARTVAECALLLEVVAGADGVDLRQPPVIEPVAYCSALERGVQGLRIGILREAFGLSDVSARVVDDAVQETAWSLERLGAASIQEVSVPMHSDGDAVWAAILFEGSVATLVGADAASSYHSDLAGFFGDRRVERAPLLPPTMKFIVLIGQWMAERYRHRYYAQARTLATELRAAYDAALEEVDLLVLPTAPTQAREIPKALTGSMLEVFDRGWGLDPNSSQFDVTGHPALSVPCGPDEELPIGIQLVGRRFEDATVLGAGRAVELARTSRSG